MTPNKLALVISYYLARFNNDGVSNLGFTSFREVCEETSRRLGVNKNYIKLRRDEFDAIFPWRVGWQAPLSRQVVRTVEAFQDLEESDIREIVLKILDDKSYPDSEDAIEISRLLEDDNNKLTRRRFILRAPTGKKAEDFFIEYHKRHGKPVIGDLKDTRDLGCGYDFEIINNESKCYVEVKGLSAVIGGIVLTDKEWRTALASGNLYYLAIVRNITEMPEISFIQNPAKMLHPKKNIYSTIQVQWSIQTNELFDSI